MPAVHPPKRRTQACRALLFLLWLGLLLHGQADVQRRLLGPAHWHVSGHAVAHHHDGSERHHHGPQDATVVTLEPLQDADATASDPAAGSLLQPLALAGPLGWWPPSAPARGWPASATPGWSDATVRQPDRPPSA